MRWRARYEAEQASFTVPLAQLETSKLVPSADKQVNETATETRVRVLELTTAETDVGIPQTRTALRVRVDVPFNNNSTGSCKSG